MTDELIKVYGLTQHLRMCQCGKQWQPASAADINCFHTDMYVAFLQQLACNAREVIDELPNHILNASVCFTETAWCALQFINRSAFLAKLQWCSAVLLFERMQNQAPPIEQHSNRHDGAA